MVGETAPTAVPATQAKKPHLITPGYKMNNYEISPYVGVGELEFGISPFMVERVLSKPNFSYYDTDTDTTTQYWNNNGLQLSFSKKNNTLTSISMYSNIRNITLPGIKFDWNTSNTTYNSLIKSDPSAMKTVGITVFFKYGIAVSGLSGEDNGNKSITAFTKGEWVSEDPYLERLT